MALWLQYLIALAALGLVAPVLAVLARRFGAKARGGLGLAALMLGIGEPLDPPVQRAIEANEEKTRETPTPGDPPTT